ncbi:hypothetical protein [Bacillus wiedmannii]|uniref:hypothetical protein n=1 Tax=Bacillus wiedmannii TaxID=1890302 RepID=UPI003D991EA1
MRKVLRHEGLEGGARQRKAEAARSDCEGDGASDVEALFCLAGRSEATEQSSRWS